MAPPEAQRQGDEIAAGSAPELPGAEAGERHQRPVPEDCTVLCVCQLSHVRLHILFLQTIYHRMPARKQSRPRHGNIAEPRPERGNGVQSPDREPERRVRCSA